MRAFRYLKADSRTPLKSKLRNADSILRALSRHLMANYDINRAFERLAWEGLIDIDEERVDGLSRMLERIEELRRDILSGYTLNHILDYLRDDLRDALELSHPPGLRDEVEKIRIWLEKGFPENLVQNIRTAKRLLGFRPSARFWRSYRHFLRKILGFDTVLRKDLSLETEEVASAVKGLCELLSSPASAVEVNSYLGSVSDVFGVSGGIERLVEALREERAALGIVLSSLPYPLRLALDSLITAERRNLPHWFEKLEEILNGTDSTSRSRKYQFTGKRRINLDSALDLARKLFKLERLEKSLIRASLSSDLSHINRDLLSELLGDLAGHSLEKLQQLTSVLAEHGYLKVDQGGYFLTSKAWRRMEDLIVLDILKKIKTSGPRNTTLERSGTGSLSGETKPYEYGDRFVIAICDTLMSAIRKASNPIRLSPEDFVVYTEEAQDRTDTVMLIDMSSSMDEVFPEVKRVAIAMDCLIRTHFPRDHLHIMGFYTLARSIKREDIMKLSPKPLFLGPIPDTVDYKLLLKKDLEESSDWPADFTNMQHALRLARRILSSSFSSAKHIIVITDGEPTACISDGVVHLNQSSSQYIMDKTLKEVYHCASAGIHLTVYLLAKNEDARRFADAMGRIGRGAVIFVSPDTLGFCMIRDYLNKRLWDKPLS